MHPRGNLLRSGSSPSFGSTLGVIGFVQVRLVCLGAPRGSLGSFWFVLFLWMRLEGRWLHGSASSSYGLGVAGFVRVLSGSFICATV